MRAKNQLAYVVLLQYVSRSIYESLVGLKSLCRPESVASECHHNEPSVLKEQTIYEFDKAKGITSSSSGAGAVQHAFKHSQRPNC